ncbi:hypothetical protein IPV09_07850 [Tessaracoccus sp. SD287]|uniref:hypothetical protein n=1 Tax=Tessaracoccus sp. SD287 TaxID=2782008 RepID=UPI001A966130|nr:hypothetical protein [Tessaracoccus sp. SD287]MBO1031249.1 hypothetical protein [Tessaracoccus sp. SD287]
MTGIPAKATVAITRQGTLQSGEFKSLVTVEKSNFKRSEYDLHPTAKTYDVTAVIAASGDVKTAEISSAVVLLDGSGKIVGGAWLDFTSAPERLASGEKVQARASVYVPKGTPTKVVLYVW